MTGLHGGRRWSDDRACGGDPVNKTDPSGMCGFGCLVGIGAGAVGLGATVVGLVATGPVVVPVAGAIAAGAGAVALGEAIACGIDSSC